VSAWESAYRWPDGVQFDGRDGDRIRMQVSMPTDERGFIGRQCASCSQLFRIDSDAYQTLPDDHTELWCVYCGYHDGHGEFITDQQLERAERAVGDMAEQYVQQMLDNAFGGMATPRRDSSFGIKITYRSKPFYPQPLPGINEEELIRHYVRINASQVIGRRIRVADLPSNWWG
jgi:Zn ribbon nucleic-acid-binding protein